MKEIKLTSLLLNLTLCLMIVIGVHSNAEASVAIATVGPNTSAPNVFYSGGCNGNFTLATNNAFIRSKVGFGFNPNVTVTFSLMVGNCASYQINPQGIWHLILNDPNGNPTTFTVTDNFNGNILLQGSFRGAILHGRSGNSSLALTLWQDNVNYNAASLWFPAGGFAMNNGSLSVAILSQAPVFAPQDDNGGPQAFQANGDINFGRQ
ncbi:MAG TPA: hypothetical protein VF604_01590 [Pyrinomonadaceae bacterium]